MQPQIYLFIVNNSKIAFQKYKKHKHNIRITKKYQVLLWESVDRQLTERIAIILITFSYSKIKIKQILREIMITHIKYLLPDFEQ